MRSLRWEVLSRMKMFWYIPCFSHYTSISNSLLLSKEFHLVITTDSFQILPSVEFSLLLFCWDYFSCKYYCTLGINLGNQEIVVLFTRLVQNSDLMLISFHFFHCTLHCLVHKLFGTKILSLRACWFVSTLRRHN